MVVLTLQSLLCSYQCFFLGHSCWSCWKRCQASGDDVPLQKNQAHQRNLLSILQKIKVSVASNLNFSKYRVGNSYNHIGLDFFRPSPRETISHSRGGCSAFDSYSCWGFQVPQTSCHI